VTQPGADPTARQGSHRTAMWAGGVICVLLLVGAAILFAVTKPSAPGQLANPAQSLSYVGVYERDAVGSYAGVNGFTTATGVRPDLVMYYSTWKEPFQLGFATLAAQHGAAPLVQIDPTGISLSAIAAGTYDSYLTSYALAVRAYRRPVILSFGHEMNGYWYSWGGRKTSPATFVAAWRHIVEMFRRLGATNVTWLWTVNIVDPNGGIPSPAPWWPGGKYVNWVGIDGYYYNPSWEFTSLFGPTIVDVRALTHDPILISETAAAAGSQPVKIADLFSGIRLYGLLGFVWFDANAAEDWSLSGGAAFAALRRESQMYYRPAPMTSRQRPKGPADTGFLGLTQTAGMTSLGSPS
jgi:mannan endo-1,4-beta-mannosidase